MNYYRIYFLLGIAAGTLGAIAVFIAMMFTAWLMVDFIAMP
ncbi:hypothetical protein [Vibrio panuliri]|nr:hypothetical protein [Vibrio panuliri]